MKRLCKVILVVLLLLSGSGVAVAHTNDTPVKNKMQLAGELLEAYKDGEALALYEQVLSESPDNYEALCKASFLHCRIGDRFTDETTKMSHFEKARQQALNAYIINPKDAESNYVMALSLGATAMVAGPTQRLQAIFQIKPYLDEALSYNSKHDGAWYIMSRWYFKVANLNIAEQAAAKVLFGGSKGKVTNNDAIDALTKAIAYNPSHIRYYYDLACIYDEMKDSTACRRTLEKALTIDLHTNDELELNRRCKLMLQRYTT